MGQRTDPLRSTSGSRASSNSPREESPNPAPFCLFHMTARNGAVGVSSKE